MRRPVYTKDRKARIVSTANGQWQCQRLSGKEGRNAQKATKYESALSHYDPWEAMHRPTLKAEALRQLRSLGEVNE